VVIKSMIDAGFLTEKNLTEIDQNLNYKSDRTQRLYFADLVFEQFHEFLSKKDLQNKTIKITSSLDEEIQQKLETVFDEFIEKNQAKLGKSEVAVVIMDKEGAVLGIAGGKDYQQSQFNRAIYAKRQAGSAFKTFVYLAAFENGLKPDDVFEDKKINIGTWLPDNYNDRYFGSVTLQEAFAHSLNSVSVQLERKIGGVTIAKMARKIGIISAIDRNDPTIALGTTEVSLFELTSAYATIASGGKPVLPYLISEIRNGKNELLYQRQSSGLESVISDEAEENIKKLLREVVVSGTGKSADVGKDIYGKTGTSQNFRDAWFVGFDDRYVIGVWIGNDDNSPTNKITGGSLPATLFAEIISKI
jgi:penicillin-binding protein 1A